MILQLFADEGIVIVFLIMSIYFQISSNKRKNLILHRGDNVPPS